ncbi:MAG: flagellar motor switch protein FliM [Candidatus Midichloriaceae bacterium]|jgi:flagellar motor switch protein FliM
MKKNTKEFGNIFEQNKYSSANFPLLRNVYDSMLRLFSKKIQNFLGVPVKLSLEESANSSFGEELNKHASSITSVMELEGEKDIKEALVIVENDFVYSLLDIFLGASSYDATLEVKGREFTNIEECIVKDFCCSLISTLNKSFSDVSDVGFQFQRLEKNKNSALIVDEDEGCDIVRLKIEPEKKKSGIITIVIPYSTLQSHKSELSKISLKNTDDKFKEKWLEYFENTLQNSNVKVGIKHSERIDGFKDLSEIKVGNTIVLNKLENEDWDVVVNDVKVSSCKLGKVNNRVAVKLVEQINSAKYIN